ncbi:EAL domain-containing protein [Litoribrevibacter euphylliae]|uniref:EAL domain-containing protein n=1 Tax=Litoribrevibacter euphylliae TaxID=1834034 RepID=A0ABV7HCZ2_9GAMM
MKPNYDFTWMRCLIIDDSHSVSDYLATLLRESLQLKEVFVAYNAIEALNIIESHPDIHVVLCDLNMEKVDGLEMIRLLREKRFRGYFGIISSMAAKVINSAEQLARVHDINLLGSLAKPISEDAIIKLLSSIGEKPKHKSALSEGSLKIYELIRGIEKEQFEVFYQPKINCVNRSVFGIEALTRLNHPRLGLIFPDRFIEAMERTALINELTKYVLEKSLSQWRHWQAKGHLLNIAVNISPKEICNLDFPEYVLNLLKENSVPPEYLTLEITESALELDETDSLEVLNRLSMHGVKLSIDDFGTGHSSLERLRIYPFDELKVDKSFMLHARENDNDRAIVESSVMLAKRLGLKVVFEGIENSELYNMSDHLGGDVIQGYYMSRPMQEDDLIGWIEDWISRNS